MRFISTLVFLWISQALFAVSVTWTGAMDNNWSNAANWSPSQVPGAADQVTVSGYNGFLNSNFTFAELTLNGCTIDGLSTFSLVVNGSCTVSLSTVNNLTLDVTGSSFIMSMSNSAGCNFDIVSGTLTLNNNLIQGTGLKLFRQTGTTNVTQTGGNSISNAEFILNGSGNWIFGNSSPDIFSDCDFVNHSTSSTIYLAHNSNGNIFNNTINLDNGTALSPGTRSIHVAREAGASLTVNGSLWLDNNGSTGIFFGENGGTTTMAMSSSFASNGFVDGTLLWAGVTAEVSVYFQIVGTTGSLIFGPNSTFNSLVYTESPRVFFNGTEFNGYTTIAKTGAGNDLSIGGNTFSTSFGSYIRNNGTGDLVFGCTNPDQFTGNLGLHNFTSSNQIRIAESSAGNLISGMLILDNGTALSPGTRSIHVAREAGASLTVNGSLWLDNNGSTGIFFGENGGTTTMAMSSSFASNGFVDGTLLWAGVTAEVSVYFQIVGTTGALIYGPNSTFNSLVYTESPRVFFNGTEFNGYTTIAKTGAGNDLSIGGNTFSTSFGSYIRNNGTGDLVFGCTNPDQFTGNLGLHNFTSSNQIRIAESSTGNLISGMLILDNGTALPPGTRSIHVAREAGSTLSVSGNLWLDNNGSTGIFFGENNGSTDFTSSSIFSSNGFVGGTLLFKNTVHNNFNTINFLSGTATLIYGPSTVINNGIDAYSPRLLFNGAEMNGNCQFTKTGASDDYSIGGNNVTFLGNVIINNEGTGDLILGNVSPDQIEGILTLRPKSQNDIHFAYNSTNNVINGELHCDISTNGSSSTRSIHLANQSNASIELNGTMRFDNNGSDGVYFGLNGGTTTFTLNSILSSQSGFAGGKLEMHNVTCDKFATIDFMINDSELKLGPNMVINEPMTAYAPGLFLNGVTTNADCSFIKLGTSSDLSVGNNTYNNPVVLQNNSSGNLNLAGTSNDTYNDVLYVRNNSTGNIDISNTANAMIYGNLVLDGFSTCINGLNSGTAIFTGGNAQTISGTGSFNPTIGKMRMSKSGNDLTLNTPLDIVTEVDFITGRIFTNSTNYLQFLDNAVVEENNISSNSFVSGPVRKVGDDFFAFPVGKGERYQPCAIDPPSSVNDVFTAEYFASNSHDLYTHSSKVPSLNNISTCDYWTIDRTVGTSDVAVWLSWNSPGCNGMTNLSEVVIARWDGGMWQDHGQANVNGDVNNGHMSTASAVSSFSPFALASLTPNNPLPVELIDFSAQKGEGRINQLLWSTATEQNSSHFEIQRSLNGIDFQTIGTVQSAGNSTETNYYDFEDMALPLEVIYYRLKMVDIDGAFDLSEVRSIYREEISQVILYPNPIQQGEKVHILGNYTQIEITNDLGQVVWYGNTESISKISLYPGVYFVNITKTDGTTQMEKLIVQ